MVRKHPFDLSALVERIVERHRPVAAVREVQIEHAVPEAPLSVVGDVTLVEQAVSNLVHNAVRYNRPGGHVAVVLDEAEGGAFVLRVSDDGPGVPKDQMPRLGERRFRTDDARSRQPEGLGIGLSIAAGVAERHGFTLSFAPNEPSGLVAELRGMRVIQDSDGRPSSETGTPE
jgi:signal transduction histidine kinase